MRQTVYFAIMNFRRDDATQTAFNTPNTRKTHNTHKTQIIQATGATNTLNKEQPVPAATVVLIRENDREPGIEVLLLRRNSKLVFHGGHWVFPGGRIDASDFAAAEGGLEYPAAQLAAIRETREEAGIEIRVEQLIHTAHWTTPPRLPRRFSTWFFVCPLRHAVEVNVDNDEILEFRWLSPDQALAEADAEQLVLPRPTRVTLKDISRHQSLEALLEAASADSIRVFPEDSAWYRPAEMGYGTD